MAFDSQSNTFELCLQFIVVLFFEFEPILGLKVS